MYNDVYSSSPLYSYGYFIFLLSVEHEELTGFSHGQYAKEVACWLPNL